jgi:hypothetical protein
MYFPNSKHTMRGTVKTVCDSGKVAVNRESHTQIRNHFMVDQFELGCGFDSLYDFYLSKKRKKGISEIARRFDVSISRVASIIDKAIRYEVYRMNNYNKNGIYKTQYSEEFKHLNIF